MNLTDSLVSCRGVPGLCGPGTLPVRIDSGGASTSLAVDRSVGRSAVRQGFVACLLKLLLGQVTVVPCRFVKRFFSFNPRLGAILAETH